MAVKLRKIGDQVMVVTGASSGIGLATAKLAAERGACVVLTARDEDGLRQAVEGIRTAGGRAAYVVADVADRDALEQVAATAVREFGRLDTWVNNAGVAIYGRLEDVPVDDARRLFETNYFGMVNGALAALPYLKRRGGALINIGSVVSDRAIPLQGHYAASKHAVKGFTDALRMELEKEGAPVSVTLVKPGSIDTPYPMHARNYMDNEPRLPAPAYEPDVVARAVIACAERPTRDVVVGGGGKMIAAMEQIPRVADRYMEATMFEQQQFADRPSPPDRPDNLYMPQPGAERGNYPGRAMKSSAYTAAAFHPVATLMGVAAIGAGLVLATRARE
jgi:short-subunit dehydrogenase